MTNVVLLLAAGAAAIGCAAPAPAIVVNASMRRWRARVLRLSAPAVKLWSAAEDRRHSIAWLKTPSLALNGQQPIDLMASDPGAKIVRDELNRIRYGHWA